MKKLILAALIACTMGCSERGEIEEPPTELLKINGKVYKILSVVPRNGARAIWIVYPKDSADTAPISDNYEVKNGKSTVVETVVRIN